MNNRFKLLVLVMVAFMCFTVYAEIKFNGDARVRPRVEQTYVDGEKSKQDIYYLYWIRMWAKAELTDGWFATAKLSADGPADFIGKFGANGNFDNLDTGTGVPLDTAFSKSDALGWDRNNSNGAIRWTEAYFGRRTDKGGFCMGLLPFNGITNPELDLHFFPAATTDLSYFIMAKNSATGFRAYYNTKKGPVTVAVTVDNSIGFDDMNDATDNLRDQYSFYANYKAKVGDMTIQPTLIKTVPGDNIAAPMTLGANFKAPKVAGLGITAGGFYTMQGVEEATFGKYGGFMVRGQVTKKVPKGLVLARIDYQSLDYDVRDDKTNTMYIWLMYKHVVYKSDLGSFALMPTFRRIAQTGGFINGKIQDFAKHRIEMTMHITF